MCAIIQATQAFVSAEIFICILLLILGFCFFVISFIDDLDQYLSEFNDSLIESQRNMSNGIQNQLFEVIQFHSDAKELSQMIIV